MDDQAIANGLAYYWGDVFSGGDINTATLNTWLQEDTCIDLSTAHWNVTLDNIKGAIKYSNNSSPGPDGASYSAYRGIAEAQSMVLAAAEAMQQHDVLPPLDFNLANMSCLPKKPVSKLENGTDLYTGDATRPLSVGNTDNRLLAASYILAMEPIYAPSVSAAQRGFLKGRSMIANILDLECLTRTTSLENERPALVLYDAFPSVNHFFMWAVLRHIGTSLEFVRAFQSLYKNHVQQVMLRGRRSKPFASTGGIRQGCPLSLLLFAVVIDLFLRRLHRNYLSSTLRLLPTTSASLATMWHI